MSKARPLRRKFCDRAQKAHTLAIAYADYVEVRETVQDGAAGTVVVKTNYTAADIDQDATAALGVFTSCACGDHYQVDVAALLRGDDTSPTRLSGHPAPGVSFDRRRNDC